MLREVSVGLFPERRGVFARERRGPAQRPIRIRRAKYPFFPIYFFPPLPVEEQFSPTFEMVSSSSSTSRNETFCLTSDFVLFSSFRSRASNILFDIRPEHEEEAAVFLSLWKSLFHPRVLVRPSSLRMWSSTVRANIILRDNFVSFGEHFSVS